MKLLFIFFLLFSSFTLYAPSVSATTSLSVTKTITVDLKGGGDFKTIKEAIDSIPDGNDEWIVIHVKAGVYREKVRLPETKGFVVIEGEGAQRTSIEWGDHASPLLYTDLRTSGYSTPESATFTSAANNVVLRGITFKNTYNKQNTNPARALAVLISGDKTSVYGCSFIGFQDTLCDLFGRHYFKDCYIEGAVDFIFGYGQSIYEGCTMYTVDGLIGSGWVTAHGRMLANDSTGFIFKSCNLTGSGKTFLGRAWGTHSRVIFYHTSMTEIVVPQGWDPWNSPDEGASTVYAEVACTGQGSKASARVKWEKKLSAWEVSKLTDLTYINSDSWINRQPTAVQ